MTNFFRLVDICFGDAQGLVGKSLKPKNARERNTRHDTLVELESLRVAGVRIGTQWARADIPRKLYWRTRHASNMNQAPAIRSPATESSRLRNVPGRRRIHVGSGRVSQEALSRCRAAISATVRSAPSLSEAKFTSNCCPRGCEALGDRGADALRGAHHDGSFAFEALHLTLQW